MQWTPLALSTLIAQHVFGGRRIPDRLGRAGLPEGQVAETWECSDVDGKGATVRDGLLAGRSLRELLERHPDELGGRGWRGPHFPVLTKFIDGTGMLPVHLHADDAAARRLESQPNGKTEAWHILDAAPGATALVGLKPGMDLDTLRDALWREDYDAALRRLPVRAGETIYVPGGTLHSFGPDTLIDEIEQTSDIQQHAMPWNMEDGSPVPSDERRRAAPRRQLRAGADRGSRRGKLMSNDRLRGSGHGSGGRHPGRQEEPIGHAAMAGFLGRSGGADHAADGGGPQQAWG